MNNIDGNSPKKVVAAESFSRYQINRSNTHGSLAVDDKLFQNSFQELKVKKKHIINSDNLDDLPGISVPLLDSAQKEEDEAKGSVGFTNRHDSISIASLRPLDKVKYSLMLLVLFLARSSLNPIMVSLTPPVVPKLVWRSVVVL